MHMHSSTQYGAGSKKVNVTKVVSYFKYNMGLDHVMVTSHHVIKFTSFFSDHPVTLVLYGLLVVENIVQYTTVKIKSAWRFLDSLRLYINKKTTLATTLLLMLPQFGMICLMRSILPQLLPVSEKG